ncbi:putative Hsp33 protein [Candidatus Terasakiella magnetica]|uniref:Putative Hsp33 protein n=1 Tax=Candidatus Terasakiella magnetica TaxID=1867952 RepID=A0A1C3RMI3_9PROT|nr:Hsp33 family molecular chaperone HslO [Candidatus Terasakiella magnetica]SCA58319.1 putative Hsp33 protein [Candidatus Terasakiella magnetica]
MSTQLLEDRILPFQVDKLDIRGRVVRLGPSVNKILDAHDYPKVIADILSEAMGLTVALASSLKYDGIFSLQAISEGEGAGPIKALVSDITSDGGLRGYAGFDADKLAALGDDSAPTVENLLGTGRLAFTVDQGKHMQPYQGITALEPGSLSECAHSYFQSSEQLDSAFKIAHGESGICVVMIQRLPDETGDDEEAQERWNHASIMLKSLTEEEMLDASLGLADLPYRLYHEDGVRVYETNTVHQECRCSEERLVTTLKGMPMPELKDMIEEGGTTVTCHFCSTDYAFSKERLTELRDEKEAEEAVKH